jgi:regulator of protease activity HflC (stomatin/prohibitin superfamily)
MKTVKIISISTLATILVGGLLLSSTLKYIEVGQVGVRTLEVGFSGKGVVPEDFGPGWHRDLGPLDSWVVFDSTVQTLELTRNPSQGSNQGADHVQVQTADGNLVSVDVTVKYHIKNGQAHSLFKNTGSGEKYKTVVRNEVDEACISQFGQMKTEDFYDSVVRRRTADTIKNLLSDSLADNFVVVVDVLIREVRFDPEYELKIRQKKLADQEVEYNKAQERAKVESGKTQLIEAETQKKIKIIQQELKATLVEMEAQTNLEVAKVKAAYEKYATEKKADADVLAAHKDAEGELLVKQAEAEGERLRNAAMRGVGGSIIVALEAAKNLKIKDITISTLEIDLLDLDAIATKLGVPPPEDKMETRMQNRSGAGANAVVK